VQPFNQKHVKTKIKTCKQHLKANKIKQ